MPATALARKSCPRCGQTFELEAAFCPADGTALISGGGPDDDPYIGRVIHGDIEIRSIAGSGAMGRVYRAHQRGVDRDVAVKILHRELSGNLPLVQRFHREGKIASKLQHPHVVDVHLAGQLPDGALYIVMEFLDGMSLAAALAASSKLFPLERAMPIALQICDAVGEGHSRGIIHRDLKPENVMLIRRAETSDWVKVLDFGIAKVNIGEQSMETAAGLIFGTARYISPEGAQGATVGPAGDVYSIAVMVYQMLAGRTPFDAEQPVGLLVKHIHEPPPPLKSWPTAHDVPDAIARVVMDNLAKDPTKRAASARAFGNALAAAAKEANVSFSDVGVAARMSLTETPARIALEPTLDDAAQQTAPLVAPIPTPDPVAAPVAPVPTTASPVAELAAADPPRSHRAATSDAPPARKRTNAILIVIAFLLGALVAALVSQRFAYRRDENRDAHVARTRRALAVGHYAEPPGENVRDLASSGLAKWPDDPTLIQLRSDAAHELVTRAMAVRSGGDVVGARDLAKTAIELDADDTSASLLLDQYESELIAMSGDAGGALGGARVLLEVPIGKAHVGSPVELTARVLVGNSPRPNVRSAQFTLRGAGLPQTGTTLRAAGTGPYHVTFSAPRAGAYDVVFEANVDGAPLRAARRLDVAK